MSATNGKARLNSSQVFLLQTLSKHPRGLTRDQLEEKAGVSASTGNLGPVLGETIASHPDSLLGMKLVAVEREDDDEPPTYTITSKGGKVAGAMSTRPRLDTDHRIPPKVLDAAVVKVKVLKTYTYELYTEVDLKEVRELLGEEHSKVDLEHLRQQIINRRKQGAFTDREAGKARAALRLIKQFEKSICPECLKKIHKAAGIKE